jgi:hypothetical protein
MPQDLTVLQFKTRGVEIECSCRECRKFDTDRLDTTDQYELLVMCVACYLEAYGSSLFQQNPYYNS